MWAGKDRHHEKCDRLFHYLIAEMVDRYTFQAISSGQLAQLSGLINPPKSAITTQADLSSFWTSQRGAAREVARQIHRISAKSDLCLLESSLMCFELAHVKMRTVASIDFCGATECRPSGYQWVYSCRLKGDEFPLENAPIWDRALEAMRGHAKQAAARQVLHSHYMGSPDEASLNDELASTALLLEALQNENERQASRASSSPSNFKLHLVADRLSSSEDKSAIVATLRRYVADAWRAYVRLLDGAPRSYDWFELELGFADVGDGSPVSVTPVNDKVSDFRRQWIEERIAVGQDYTSWLLDRAGVADASSGRLNAVSKCSSTSMKDWIRDLREERRPCW